MSKKVLNEQESAGALIVLILRQELAEIRFNKVFKLFKKIELKRQSKLIGATFLIKKHIIGLLNYSHLTKRHWSISLKHLVVINFSMIPLT